LTRGQALEARNKLVSDPVFFKKMMEDPQGAAAELADLAKAIVGTPEHWSRPPAYYGRETDLEGHEVHNTDYSKYDIKP